MHTCTLGPLHTHTHSLGSLHADVQFEVIAHTDVQFRVTACTRAVSGHCTHTIWDHCKQMCSLGSLHAHTHGLGSLHTDVQFEVTAHTHTIWGHHPHRCAVWGHFMHTCTAGVIAHTHAKCESLHSHMHSLGSLHTRAVFGGHCIHTDVHFGGHCTPTCTAVLHNPRAARAIPNLLRMHTLQHGQCMQTAACSAGCLLHNVHGCCAHSTPVADSCLPVAAACSLHAPSCTPSLQHACSPQHNPAAPSTTLQPSTLPLQPPSLTSSTSDFAFLPVARVMGGSPGSAPPSSRRCRVGVPSSSSCGVVGGGGRTPKAISVGTAPWHGASKKTPNPHRAWGPPHPAAAYREVEGVDDPPGGAAAAVAVDLDLGGVQQPFAIGDLIGPLEAQHDGAQRAQRLALGRHLWGTVWGWH